MRIPHDFQEKQFFGTALRINELNLGGWKCNHTLIGVLMWPVTAVRKFMEGKQSQGTASASESRRRPEGSAPGVLAYLLSAWEFMPFLCKGAY
jgi:hypothetical protein